MANNTYKTIVNDYAIVAISIPVNGAAATLRSLIAAAAPSLPLSGVAGILIDDASADFIYGKTTVGADGRTVDFSDGDILDLPVGGAGILNTYVQASAGVAIAVKAMVYLGEVG